jgi:hypothetical protein
MMKNLKLLALLMPVILTGSITTCWAQSKTEKSASAMAAYGISPAPAKHKSKKKQKAQKNKQPKTYQTRPPKIVKERKATYKKRNNWAS